MNGTGSLAIETSGLTYIFRYGIKVVNDVSLKVPEGGIYGFLGPNGAGKTTTIRLLTGMLENEPDNIFIRGQSLKKTMPALFTGIGTLIETPSLYLHLSGKDNLRVITRLRSISKNKVDDVLKTTGLYKDRNRKVKEYSLGMKQRLGIAMALLPDPSLFILDEPANGLDPAGIIEIRELLKKLNKEEGKTIFISSHLLSEVEKTCTHIGIIHKGLLKFQGSMQELRLMAEQGRAVTFKIADASQWYELIREKFPAAKHTGEDEFVFETENSGDASRINRELVQYGVPVRGIRQPEGLEEWFMKITSN